MSQTDADGRDPYEGYDLPLKPFEGSAEEVEQKWLNQCYNGRGDSIPQLTVRAVLMGCGLGAILSLTNLYIGLRAGWHFGVAITACILSYAIWTLFTKVGIAKTPMTILENNCMQSAASSAGYSTGGTLISAFAAYMMLNPSPEAQFSVPIMMAWVFLVAVLGVTLAIPMKRSMVNIDQLPFPSGIAAAETLRALHAHGQKGQRAARALSIAGIAAAASQFCTEGLNLVSHGLERFQLSSLVKRANEATLGTAWMGRTVMFSWDPIFIAAGMIVGTRVGWSMLLGSISCWVVFIPWCQSHIPELSGVAGYRALVQWCLWGGVACMVSSSLLAIGLQWRSALRAFKSLGAMFGGSKGTDPMEEIETPISWFLYGQIFSLIGLAFLAHHSFGMPYWQSFLAVAMTFALGLVACRVTGETDTTPTGAMGKIMQLTFGVLSPGNMNINLMSANITAGAASASADLLTDLKSGYLLGANPRKQFLAQFSGIFIGTLMSVIAFKLIVSDASVLGSDQFPAPAAQAWKGVAEAMAKGLSNMHPIKIWSIAIGGGIGILLPVLCKLFPKQQKYIPAASAIGLTWTFQFYTAILFFIGSVVGLIWKKRDEAHCEEFLFPVASGIIASGALMGVVLIFWENGADMLKRLAEGF